MDWIREEIKRDNPGFNMNLYEKRGHEGETFVAKVSAFPHHLMHAADKYGSARKFVEAILNGDTWYAPDGEKYTLVPDKPGLFGKILTGASIALGAVSTFIPVVAPFAAGAAVGAAATNNAVKKAAAEQPFQVQHVINSFLQPLPGDVLFTGRTDMPPGLYYDAVTKDYLYTVNANGEAIYAPAWKQNDLGSTDWTDPVYFPENAVLSRIYLNPDGTFNSELSKFSNDVVMAFDLNKFLDTANKIVGTATNIYSGVTSNLMSSQTGTNPVIQPVVSAPAPTGTNYTSGSAPASTSSGGLSTPVLLAIVGGVIVLVLLILNKK